MSALKEKELEVLREQELPPYSRKLVSLLLRIDVGIREDVIEYRVMDEPDFSCPQLPRETIKTFKTFSELKERINEVIEKINAKKLIEDLADKEAHKADERRAIVKRLNKIREGISS